MARDHFYFGCDRSLVGLKCSTWIPDNRFRSYSFGTFSTWIRGGNLSIGFGASLHIHTQENTNQIYSFYVNIHNFFHTRTLQQLHCWRIDLPLIIMVSLSFPIHPNRFALHWMPNYGRSVKRRLTDFQIIFWSRWLWSHLSNMTGRVRFPIP